MIITPDVLRALNTVFSKAFQGGLTAADTQYQQLATVIPSTTSSNTYGFLGMFPKMREWFDERTLLDMASQGKAVINRKFEATVSVPRTDIEDDNIGLYAPMMQQMGQSAGELPDELVFEAIMNGETGISYDGQNFFDTEHPVFPNVDRTGTPTLVSNMTAGSDTPWYILDTTNAIKPFIYQQRLKPELEIKTDPSRSDEVFMKDLYLYGIRARGEASYGLWQFAHLSKAKLERASVAATVARMQSIRGDGKKVLRVRPSLLVVPPLLADAAFEIVEAAIINGTSNSMKGRLKVMVAPWLAA